MRKVGFTASPEHFTKHGVLFCVDAHRDGKRFIVKADDLLIAFLSLERDAIAPKTANENKTRSNFLWEAPPKMGTKLRSFATIHNVCEVLSYRNPEKQG
jgi:hypothetical protein